MNQKHVSAAIVFNNGHGCGCSTWHTQSWSEVDDLIEESHRHWAAATLGMKV